MLCTNLHHVDSFYDSIGGLAGYQLKCLETLASSAQMSEESAEKVAAEPKFYMPQGLNIAGNQNRRVAAAAAATGLEALPYMAEILPLGGAFHKKRSKSSRFSDLCLEKWKRYLLLRTLHFSTPVSVYRSG